MNVTFGFPAAVGALNINGNWTVNISDNAGGDIGTAQGVTLTVDWTSPAACTAPSGTAVLVNAGCSTYQVNVINVTTGNSPEV
jgi:hypothetical protein